MTPMVTSLVVLMFSYADSYDGSNEPATVTTPYSISRKTHSNFNTMTLLLSKGQSGIPEFRQPDLILQINTGQRSLLEMGKRYNIEIYGS